MQTNIVEAFLATQQGQEADRILRSCVHCGFCTATCPTYQLLGDELDGPRGRIYQMKLVFEGEPVTRQTQRHLDRCLTCLNCETTCPSGVQYHRLIDIGREYVRQRIKPALWPRLQQWLLRRLLPYQQRTRPLLKFAWALRGILPAKFANKLPVRQTPLHVATTRQHARKVLLFGGCVQPLLTPRTNQATRRLLDQLGIEAVDITNSQCCGAISQHLAHTSEAADFIRRNIDAWWPHIETGVEAIVITASGCGSMIKQYADLLKHDKAYHAKAQRIVGLAKDLCEVISEADMRKLRTYGPRRIAFHPPCTLQHAQQLQGRVERLLKSAGFELMPINNAHLCCGSAGTYSILQPQLASRLQQQKLMDLQIAEPEWIVTANIGCELHLQAGTSRPVKHWVELFVQD